MDTGKEHHNEALLLSYTNRFFPTIDLTFELCSKGTNKTKKFYIS